MKRVAGITLVLVTTAIAVPTAGAGGPPDVFERAVLRHAATQSHALDPGIAAAIRAQQQKLPSPPDAFERWAASHRP
jgi:hypothetical protein